MVKRSKRYLQAAAKVDPTKSHAPAAALQLIKSLPGTKFDETVEVAIHLGIDPKKTDQLVRGAVSLPKGLGKSVKVIVFAEGDKAAAAKAAVRHTLHPPRPPHWGGYRLQPDRWEFWQGRPNRLHDRFEYLPLAEGWEIRRLQP